MLRRQLRLFSSLLLALGMLAGSEACPALVRPAIADSSLAIVQRRGHLRIGIDAALGGTYLFWNPQTQFYDGFEWDVAREIARRLKLEARPMNVPWGGQPEALKTRQIDLILSAREAGGLANTPYANVLTETVPYYRTSQRLLVRGDGLAVKTLRDLIGRRVGVVANSGGAAVLETYNKNRGNAIRLFSSRDLDRMVQQLRNRQLDAMLLDEPVAVWQQRTYPELAIVGDPLLPIDLVVVVNQGDGALKAALDRAILEMRRDGTLETILRRWKLWNSNQQFLESTAVWPNTISKTITQYWVYL